MAMSSVVDCNVAAAGLNNVWNRATGHTVDRFVPTFVGGFVGIRKFRCPLWPRKLGLLPSAKHDLEKIDKFHRLPSSQPKLISPKRESEIPVVTSVGMDKILLHHLVFLTKVTCARFLTTQRDYDEQSHHANDRKEVEISVQLREECMLLGFLHILKRFLQSKLKEPKGFNT
jgi:hypothetical protein